MLIFRAWEIKTDRIKKDHKNYTPELSFRYIEKVFLLLIKHIIQSIVLSSVKAWFIITTKIKKWIANKLPRLDKFFKKETKILDPRKISFIQRAVIESKIKIKKVKEKIKKEHEEVIEKIDEVDKII